MTGCSAGGLSTYQHSDTIQQWFPKAVVKAAAVSGFFLPIQNIQGVRVYTEELEVRSYLSNMVLVLMLNSHAVRVRHAKLDCWRASRMSCVQTTEP